MVISLGLILCLDCSYHINVARGNDSVCRHRCWRLEHREMLAVKLYGGSK